MKVKRKSVAEQKKKENQYQLNYKLKIFLILVKVLSQEDYI